MLGIASFLFPAEELEEDSPGVVGFPITGVEIVLGAENEIFVKGPNVMRGYFRQPEVTSKVFSDGRPASWSLNPASTISQN